MFMDMDQKQRCADDIHDKKAHCMMDEISLIKHEVKMIPEIVGKQMNRGRIPVDGLPLEEEVKAKVATVLGRLESVTAKLK